MKTENGKLKMIARKCKKRRKEVKRLTKTLGLCCRESGKRI